MCNVDAFLNDAARLLDQFRVNYREERRVVPDVVFHYEQHGHAHGARVVQDVALVLDVFDDSDENSRVALPEENPFDICDRIALDEILDGAVIVCEHNYGNVEA